MAIPGGCAKTMSETRQMTLTGCRRTPRVWTGRNWKILHWHRRSWGRRGRLWGRWADRSAVGWPRTPSGGTFRTSARPTWLLCRPLTTSQQLRISSDVLSRSSRDLKWENRLGLHKAYVIWCNCTCTWSLCIKFTILAALSVTGFWRQARGMIPARFLPQWISHQPVS